MTRVDDVSTLAAEPASLEVRRWTRENWVTLAALALIAGQLWLKGAALSHAFFRQDDFANLDQALGTRLSWGYLMTLSNGHLIPATFAYIWVLARVSIYDWTLTSTLSLALLALSCLAMFRVLRTIFGNRPAVLVLLILYLFSPIMLPGFSFWSDTLQWLPAQLFIPMALNAHLAYLRTGRYWHVAVAAIWISIGMLIDDVAALIPLLLFAISFSYFSSGHWTTAALDMLRRHWRVWLAYLVLLASYTAVFVYQMTGSQVFKPQNFSTVLAFTFQLTLVSLIPAALGGPWKWFSSGQIGYATEVPVLTHLAWAVAGLIIAVSLWYRRRSARAWLILAGWVLASAVVPLVLGRLGGGAQLLGGDLHYLADSLPVLVVCAGLAFLPVVGEDSAYRGRLPEIRIRRAATAGVLGLFMVGALWSNHSYQNDTTGAPNRSYLATVRAAVAAAPQGATIVDTVTPPNVELAFYYGRYHWLSQFAGPIIPPGQHLHWTRSPSGVFPNLLIFDPLGRLTGVGVTGVSSQPAAALHGCWTVGANRVVLPMPGLPSLYRWNWMIRLSYHGPSSGLAVEFGGIWHNVALPAGQHDVYVPATGAGRVIAAQVVSGGPDICVSQVQIGVLAPSYHQFPIPFKPVPG
jgi:hypothetical protein